MNPAGIPGELSEARRHIDEIDRELIELLAKRFSLTHRVGKLKARFGLEPVDAGREEEKLQELRELCNRHSLDAGLVSELFARIMEEVVRNHEQLRRRTRQESEQA